MKQLLFAMLMVSPLIGLAQEKKGICSSAIQFYHPNGADYSLADHFRLDGFSFNNPLYYGGFHIDYTNLSPVTIYEVTLPFGDSLQYSASWRADGLCQPLSGPEEVDSILTILEGTPFPIIHEGSYDGYNYYSLSQRGIVRDACLIQIKAEHSGATPYFVRIKFSDPPAPETPLDLPEITNDISMWISGENTLSVKADENVGWEINLYSLSGQVLQKATSEGSQMLDVSNLPKGYYIARVSSENGLEKQLKFIR